MRFFVLLSLCAIAFASPSGSRLYDHLLRSYQKLDIPKKDSSDVLKVNIGIDIKNADIIESQGSDGKMFLNAWLKYSWDDYRFQWDPKEYGNRTDIKLPKEYIWIPDMRLYNSLQKVEQLFDTDVVVYQDGSIHWIPPFIFEVACNNIANKSEDKQLSCTLKFGSWTYSGGDIEPIPSGVDMSKYRTNDLWTLEETTTKRSTKWYECCPEPYYDITFTLRFKKHSDFVDFIV